MPILTIDGAEPTLIEASELGIDADQEMAGIVEAVEIRWKDITFVAAITKEGMYAYGASIRNPFRPHRPLMARATAWQRVLESILRNRDKFLARQKVRV
jgi:hypothetical protein